MMGTLVVIWVEKEFLGRSEMGSVTTTFRHSHWLKSGGLDIWPSFDELLTVEGKGFYICRASNSL